MRLQVHDQIHISSIKSENLRRGEVVDVNDALGAELLKKHPTIFTETDEKAEGAAPNNKMEGAAQPEKTDYSKLTVPALKALATEREVDLSDAHNKADVIAALELADEAAAEDGANSAED